MASWQNYIFFAEAPGDYSKFLRSSRTIVSQVNWILMHWLSRGHILVTPFWMGALLLKDKRAY